MAEFITLTCPTCGGRLEIGEDVERFACAHCGNEHIVNRGGGLVTIKPILESLQNIDKATDRTAAELAIGRLTIEVADLEKQLLTMIEEFPAVIGLKKVLQDMGKISFLEYSFIKPSAVNKRIQDLSIEELELLIKKMESGIGKLRKGAIGNLKAIRDIKVKIEETSAKLERNKKVVD